MSQLEEIKARAGKATEGPWVTFKGDHFAAGVTSSSSTLTWDDHGGEVFKPADAEFIAHARTDVPKLIAALEAVEALHVRRLGKWTDSSGIPWMGDHCTECRDEWPCLTAAAITEALQ